MTDKYQYKVIVNDAEGAVVDSVANWTDIAQIIEDRGGIATQYRRLVTDTTIFTDWGMPRDGWIVMGKLAVGPWEVFAQVEA